MFIGVDVVREVLDGPPFLVPRSWSDIALTAVMLVAAPFLALFAMPVVAVTALLGCLVSGHFLATHPDWPLIRRRAAALGCGVLTGLVLWAVSAWTMGSMMTTSGAAWIAPAALAVLTMHKFLYARGRRGSYRDN
ncbi:hypothetical protein [Sphingomonas glaciei]|uniref:Uncharacterized protein n=1 Tax=Sphingomonas glaciei TaxID=2938948 RepID=A0ABY5MU85_9SPHN|nr:hypothetical protein [Sphingomonas glaciei]UUR08068.1 hypothetical protein M1K48_14280 [Sphingomonas glaciei]